MVLISFDKDLPREEESLKEPKWHPIFRKLCKKRNFSSLHQCCLFCKLNDLTWYQRKWKDPGEEKGKMNDLIYWSIMLLRLMTILRYDDDTIHRNGLLFGAPADSSHQDHNHKGRPAAQLDGRSDHKSLFSPYQNEHVGSMWKQLPLHCSSSPTHWCMYIIFSQ